MPETDAEIVLQTEDQRQETDITVESADEAAKRFVAAGGKTIVQAFDIQIANAWWLRIPLVTRWFCLISAKVC
jgi:hypothetical protein